jgi:hypothetical protein
MLLNLDNIDLDFLKISNYFDKNIEVVLDENLDSGTGLDAST